MQSSKQHSSPHRKLAWTIWFTGLSGSGKSTLARALASRLRSLSISYEILDGDEIRKQICSDLGFSRRDRNENIRRIGYITRLLNRHNVVSIVAAISPYEEMREDVRRRSARFLQVHVDCPLETLIQRDTKGFYRLALAGEMAQFSGISDIYESPVSPDLYLDTGELTREQCLALIITKLQDLKWLPPSEPTQTTRSRLAASPAGIAVTAGITWFASVAKHSRWRPLFAFALVALALAANWAAQSIWGSSSPLILAAGVSLSTFALGLPAGLVSVVAASLVADYFYIAPVFNLTLNEDTFWISVHFLAIAIATHLAVRLLTNRRSTATGSTPTSML